LIRRSWRRGWRRGGWDKHDGLFVRRLSIDFQESSKKHTEIQPANSHRISCMGPRAKVPLTEILSGSILFTVEEQCGDISSWMY
jgi:hypothetical protein